MGFYIRNDDWVWFYCRYECKKGYINDVKYKVICGVNFFFNVFCEYLI